MTKTGRTRLLFILVGSLIVLSAFIMAITSEPDTVEAEAARRIG